MAIIGEIKESKVDIFLDKKEEEYKKTLDKGDCEVFCADELYLFMVKMMREFNEEYQREIKSVLNFLEGNVPREKIINYIKEYLLD